MEPHEQRALDDVAVDVYDARVDVAEMHATITRLLAVLPVLPRIEHADIPRDPLD
jgi:hypothetical protein